MLSFRTLVIRRVGGLEALVGGHEIQVHVIRRVGGLEVNSTVAAATPGSYPPCRRLRSVAGWY